MPNVYKGSDGRYVYKTHEEYNGVKFICRGTSTKGKTEAKKAWKKNYEQKIAELDNKKDTSENKVRISEMLPQWYSLFIETSKRELRTIRTDKDTIKGILRDPLARLTVAEVTSTDLQGYLVRLRDEGCSISTIKKRKNMLNMMFRHYRPNDNPMNQCRLPDVKQPASKEEALTAFTDEEIEKLVIQLQKQIVEGAEGYDARAGNKIFADALTVCIYEYVRFGELAELRVKDVDFEKGIIHIERQFDEKTGEIKDPKYHSIGMVPIAKECWDILEKACEGKEKEKLIFDTRSLNRAEMAPDGHIREGAVLKFLRKAERATGIALHTVHDLRHDGISLQVRRGISADLVSRFARHKSVAFTMERYYRHTKTIDPAVIEMISGHKVRK